MIRVGYFVDTFNLGGAESVVIQLAKQLLNEPMYEPIVIHFGSDVIAARCKQLDIPDIVAPGHKLYKKTITLPLFAFIFRRFLSQLKINVLHSHLFGAIVGAAPAAMLAHITHIGTLHDIYTIEEQPKRIWLLKLASIFGAKLITVSKHMENYYRSRGKYSFKRLKTIHNGVTINEKNDGNKNRIREEFNINDNDVVITCVARLVRLKRHDVLLNALDLIKGHVKYKCLIVGGGPESLSLKNYVENIGLSSCVYFLGERDDVSAILNVTNIFVLTSDTEGLSCSILEAMAAGLPIIATDVGGNSELISDNVNGFLVDRGDIQHIAEKIMLLIEDKELRMRFGEQSCNVVMKHYNWIETFEQYKYLYISK